MAAVRENTNDLFIFADDFDAILAILEVDELLEKEIIQAVENVKEGEFVCTVCHKICKSKGGLTRHGKTHKIAKNEEQEDNMLTGELLLNILKEIQSTAIANNCYPEIIKTELEKYNFKNISEDLLSIVSCTFKKFKKNGDMEKLYSSMFPEIVLRAHDYLPQFSRDTATLLLSKLADKLIALQKECNAKCGDADNNTQEPLLLNEKEKHGLHYIGGYVFHKLYRNLKNSTSWREKSCQMSMSCLRAGRSNKVSDENSLLNKLNRGNLWEINEATEIIFLKTETYFRSLTSAKGLRNIDIEQILTKSLKDVEIKASFNKILEEADTKVMPDIAKNMLFNIISLYVRVRSFSKARSILEKHRIKEQSTKAKALRKNIKRYCEETAIIP